MGTLDFQSQWQSLAAGNRLFPGSARWQTAKTSNKTRASSERETMDEREKVCSTGASVRVRTVLVHSAMAFLFQRPPVAHSALPTFHDDEPTADTVHVSENIWNALLLPEGEKATLAIARRAGNKLPGLPGLPSITCRGVLDRNVRSLHLHTSIRAESNAILQVQELSVPRAWQSEYPHIFPTGQTRTGTSEPALSIYAVQPVTLTELIFAALSDDAYAAASADPTMLEDWLLDGDVILREGASYTYPGDVSAPGTSSSSVPHQSLSYRLVMAAPVQQGIAQRSQTKLYISASPFSRAHEGQAPEVDSIPDMIIDGSESDPSESEKGDFEIGEDFLAGSVLRSLSLTSLSPSINGHLTNGDLASTSEAESTVSNLHLSAMEWTCRAHPLQHPVLAVDDDSAVYVRTTELSRIGVLDGDWVSSFTLPYVCFMIEFVWVGDCSVQLQQLQLPSGSGACARRRREQLVRMMLFNVVIT